MKKKLIVVVDMVNGFVNIGALHDPYINRIVPGIKALVESELEKGNDVIDFRDCHSLTDEEFKNYPIHCLAGTEESELVPELQPLKGRMIDIPKDTTNGFKTDMFKKFYQEHYEEYDEIVVVGCCTDICVTDFTTSLAQFHKENGINTPIMVPMDLVETFDGPNHDRKIMNEVGFENMRKAGVNLVETYTTQKNKEFVYKKEGK